MCIWPQRRSAAFSNNTYPAEFIYENLMVEANIVHEAWRAGSRIAVSRSSCIYPRLAPQPMAENMFDRRAGTNEPYAIAKIAGIKLCESYNRQYGTTTAA
jgi:GDP-L-fucose synthase